MSAPRILVFAGSARREALSKRLLSACIRPLEAAGAQLNVVDLADYPAPLYNGDLEAESGIPPSMISLQQHLAASDGLLVVSPEYNGSIPPLLKNTLDWCSRPNPADPERSGGGIFAGRPAAVLASSPGPMGGVRVLFHLRDILGYLGMYVIPQQLGVGQAGAAIGDDLRLLDPRQQAMLEGIASALTTAACKLRA
ncbi:NADPH-dependent FMN reductase [Cognatazoarcus halotolerans]|uniref:NADPH-dependent FMN reductase n=1 Tax=Cognatazoarcus halotolerans TaxID=2686016 RepID=UPI00135B059F|nr:NAD(P)H-dependent oxidoreductase [Cognatazoarcus halotolerans]MCB1898184.1 NAD(P)H-dependent oxidoreductase [Rhodocyclaceae bacterium]MCP5307807.1 NAD(P)H-dependent oxidoreductase [Zoogloeaceae bacterium]